MRSGIYRELIRWRLWCSLPSSSGKVGRQYAAIPAGVVKIDWRLVYPPHAKHGDHAGTNDTGGSTIVPKERAGIARCALRHASFLDCWAGNADRQIGRAHV